MKSTLDRKRGTTTDAQLTALLVICVTLAIVAAMIEDRSMGWLMDLLRSYI